MIPRLPGWRWLPERDHVTLIAPNEKLGAIRYFPHRHGLVPVRELLARHVPGARVHGEPELLVTREGEHAVLSRAAVGDGGDAMHMNAGFVLDTDGYACIEAFSVPEYALELTAIVRGLLVDTKLHRAPRRRRYRFIPPPWLAHQVAEHIVFVCDDRVSKISVHGAIPIEPGARHILDLQRLPGEDILVNEAGPSSGFQTTGTTRQMPIKTRRGLTGTRVRVKGSTNGFPLERDIVVLRDDRYAYVVELTSTPTLIAHVTGVFEDVVSTIEPIPLPARIVPPGTSAFNHWAD